jgi:uncharacterized protein YkwD
MLKLLKVIWVMFLIFFSLPEAVKAESVQPAPVFLSASDLISAVNAMRTAKGLYAFQANSILTSISQSQAIYEQSIGSVTDKSANGLLPYQRALAAGYLVAGNITTGVGYLSELLYEGVGISAQDAVNWWYKDPGHEPYLMSSLYRDIGAGVAQSNNTYYFVVVVALSTGGTPVAYTPPAPLNPSTPTIVPNTPNADGSIVHIVKPGDTLGSLSMAYNVPLADILKLNNLTLKSTIFVNQKITIRAANTPTPTQPTSTPTIPPTITPWPTSTPTSTATTLPPTPTPSPGLPISAAEGAVTAILVSALVLAGLIALLGRKRK